MEEYVFGLPRLEPAHGPPRVCLVPTCRRAAKIFSLQLYTYNQVQLQFIESFAVLPYISSPCFHNAFTLEQYYRVEIREAYGDGLRDQENRLEFGRRRRRACT